MAGGRPTKYNASICEAVVGYGKSGKSRAWIAAELGICRQTMANWEKEHPEFLDATTRAGLYSQQWWEDAGQVGMISDKFNASVWSKSMAARFPDDWRDITRSEHTGKDGAAIEVVPSETEIARRVAFILSKGAK